MDDRREKLREYSTLVEQIACCISNHATYDNCEDPLRDAYDYYLGDFRRLEKICGELKIAMPFRDPDRIIFSFDGKY